MSVSSIIQSIFTLYSEAYSGPADSDSTWCIDNEPASGSLEIIAGFSSSEASWFSNNFTQGTNLHTYMKHLRWSISNANPGMQDEPQQGKWKENWNTLAVSGAKWKTVKMDLRAEFEAFTSTHTTSKITKVSDL